MIAQVRVKQLKVIADERGRLMEILRADDDLFQGFGQVYVTTAYPGVVKAWHYHKKQTDNFAVLKGMAKVVLYDARKDSPTYGQVNEFFMGDHNQILVQIPPLVYHGFKAVGNEEVILFNCPTEVYNRTEPDEHRIDPFTKDVPYDWTRHAG